MSQRYTVSLLDAPDLTNAHRDRLESAFRAAVNEQYGGEEHAAGALFAWRDQTIEEHVDAGGSSLLWPTAEAEALAQLGDRVPAGARFDCSLIWS